MIYKERGKVQQDKIKKKGKKIWKKQIFWTWGPEDGVPGDEGRGGGRGRECYQKSYRVRRRKFDVLTPVVTDGCRNSFPVIIDHESGEDEQRVPANGCLDSCLNVCITS